MNAILDGVTVHLAEIVTASQEVQEFIGVYTTHDKALTAAHKAAEQLAPGCGYPLYPRVTPVVLDL